MDVLSFLHTKISWFHLNVLFLLGLSLLGGTLGGRIFQKLKIPQVVGYIVIGIILGKTGLNIVDKHMIEALRPFNYFALGLIAFMIGGELRREIFVKYGKQFLYILFAEGLSAFFVVAIFAGFVSFFFTHNLIQSISLGLVLGAIASATDAASTINVLWEYKSKGVLTTTVLGIVALDDGLSFLLFSIVASIVSAIMRGGHTNIVHAIIHPVYEIIGSLVVGGLTGFILGYLIKKYTEEDRVLAFLIGGVLLTLGLAIALGVDMLLSAMSLGVVIANYTPKRSREVFHVVERFAAPIYVLFFVLVGAKLNVTHFNAVILSLVAAYLIGRSLGKMSGAVFGSILSNGPAKLKKYLPLCLFSQASAAIGLSILAGQIFPGELGSMIVTVVTLTTFIVQLIGPYFVRVAIIKAKEAGLNITEEDLLDQISVVEMMNRDVPLITEDMPIEKVISIVKENDYLYYPVVDREGKLKGSLTIESIRNVLTLSDLGSFILAQDLMEPVYASAFSDDKLSDVIGDLNKFECLTVVDKENKPVGVLELRRVKKSLSDKLMEMHHISESES